MRGKMGQGSRSHLRHFLRLFLPFALVVLAAALAYWNQDAKARLEILQTRELARVVRERQVMEMAFAMRAADAAQLAERVAVELRHAPDPARNIRDLFWNFAEIKRDYHVVRLVNAQGRETARVDNMPDGPRHIPDSLLQDKSDRPAFIQCMNLPDDHLHAVHVSRMDLFVEQGEIVQPLKPALHFTSPVRGPDDKKAGLVSLSLDGNVPLNRLRQSSAASLGRPMLVNRDGYWLLGPSENQEWGFLFPERKLSSIQAVWPGAWERMGTQRQGQFLLGGAMYSFDTVSASAPSGLGQAVTVFPDEDWRIVSRVAPEQLRPPLSVSFFSMVAGMLTLLAGLCWLWARAVVRRERALAELQSSEKKAQAILNAPQDAAFLLLDLDGRILAANTVTQDRFKDIFDGDLVGKSFRDIGSKDLVANRVKLLKFCVQTGESLRFDDERDGLILDNTLYPVREADGGIRHVVWLSRDVTADRAAQDQVLTLSRAVTQSQAVIVITDAQGNIEYVNPSFIQRYGYTAEEALGQNPRLLKSGRHDAAFYEELWSTLTKGEDWNGELCNRTKDGREIWERATISPVLNDEGHISHYVAVKEDVTEQRQVQQALADNEEKIRVMSEASQDGFVMVDDQGQVMFWNPAAEQIFGYSRKEVLGQRLHPLVAPDDDAVKAQAAFPDFAKTGTGPIVDTVSEQVARRKDGSTFPAELSLGVFRHQDRWWAVATVRDITERKRTEGLLLELATTDGLTGLVNRRHFMERGNAELERSRRTGHEVSCLMFDVDHFKKVNDTYGHDAGDAVLKSLAVVAHKTLRSIDILGRLGGEEFAAILPETGLEAALQAAERLRQAAAGMELCHGGVPIAVTVSLGVATLRSEGDDSLDSLLKRADTGMYKAKQSGRNRVVAG